MFYGFAFAFQITLRAVELLYLQIDETFAFMLQFIGTYREGEEDTCDQFK
jgi:hypothetical protein